jgi:hypothetical protein
MRLKIAVELEGEKDLTKQITEGEVAFLLGVSETSLRMLRLQSRGPRVWRIVDKVSPRFRLLDVLRYAQRHTRFSLQDPPTTRHHAAPRGSKNIT